MIPFGEKEEFFADGLMKWNQKSRDSIGLIRMGAEIGTGIIEAGYDVDEDSVQEKNYKSFMETLDYLNAAAIHLTITSKYNNGNYYLMFEYLDDKGESCCCDGTKASEKEMVAHIMRYVGIVKTQLEKLSTLSGYNKTFIFWNMANDLDSVINHYIDF